MSNDLGSTLDSLGFTSDDSVAPLVKSASKKDLTALQDILRCALSETAHGEVVPSPFNFLASSNFRGERCCSSPSCRVGSSEDSSRFAALYADKLFFPILLGDKEDRQLTEGAVRVLLALRPLIDAGIVVPTPTSPSLCKGCWERLDPLFESANESSKALLNRYRADFTVDARKRTVGKKTFFEYDIQGPEELISGKSIIFISEVLPSWGNDLSVRGKKTLSASEIEQARVLESVLHASCKDFVLSKRTWSTLGSDIFNKSNWGS